MRREDSLKTITHVWKSLWDEVRVVNDTSEKIVVSVSATGWFESDADYTIDSGESETWSRNPKNGPVKVSIRSRGAGRSAIREVGVILASEILN